MLPDNVRSLVPPRPQNCSQTTFNTHAGLLSKPSQVNRATSRGETALMHGAASGSTKIVRMLVQVSEADLP